MAIQAKGHHRVWTHTHCSFHGNLVAHTSARELAGPHGTTSRGWTNHYLHTNIINSDPSGCPSLAKEQEMVFRQIKTNTFPHPACLHIIFPALCPSTCPRSGESATPCHMLRACQLNAATEAIPTPRGKQGERQPTSSRLEDQPRLVHRAMAAPRPAGLLNSAHSQSIFLLLALGPACLKLGPHTPSSPPPTRAATSGRQACISWPRPQRGR